MFDACALMNNLKKRVANNKNKFEKKTMSTSTPYDKYTEFICQCVDEQEEKKGQKISQFKSNPIYQDILEHVTEDLGKQYLDLLLDILLPHTLIKEFCALNDKLGSPKRYRFNVSSSSTITHVFCSPTSLRYLYHASLILKHMKYVQKNEDPFHIVEIGAGYGGLCLAIHFLLTHEKSPFQNIVNIHSYHTIDLYQPTRLQNWYVNSNFSLSFPFFTHVADTYGADIVKTIEQSSCTNINDENKTSTSTSTNTESPVGHALHSQECLMTVCSYEGTDDENNKPFNFFLISNYAFSEIDSEHQKQYVNILFPHISHGFLTWNMCPLFDIGKEVTVVQEKPQTDFATRANKFVTF